MAEKIEKIVHANIYAALSAFQGENPEIKKTKNVDIRLDSGRSIKYKYAPLDEFVSTIRPLLAKHGLSFTHEEAGKGEIQCVLYHETSSRSFRKVDIENNSGTVSLPPSAFEPVEVNIIRSMPITVKRAGDMKAIGGDSTYARRYTLAEVTGCASDEDNDAPQEKEAAINAKNTVFVSWKKKLETAKKPELEKALETINSDMDLIDAKKAPKHGLSEEQYEELGRIADARLAGLAVKEDIQTEDPTV